MDITEQRELHRMMEGADDREILQGEGKITEEIAKTKAKTKFEKHRVIQDYIKLTNP